MANEESQRSKQDEESLKLGEALKKLVSVGIGAAFMTEESIRSYLSEMKLPKEALNFVLQSAAKSKDELVGRVQGEVVKILSRIDVVKEITKFAETHKFTIKAEVEITKKNTDS